MSGALPLPVAGYGVILADTPWRFELRSDEGEEKSPQAQYDCMATADICALKDSLGLDWICAPDCVLALWATAPMLPDAFRVMAAWGFAYKTAGAWGKVTRAGKPAMGTGYIYRSACEFWLLGTRGDPRPRSRGIRNLILARRRQHSRKPDQMHSDLEALFPGPYLELFARQRRSGWDAWGNQVDHFPAKEAVNDSR